MEKTDKMDATASIGAASVDRESDPRAQYEAHTSASVMDHFLAHFDPLAMLDAEYAAVISQSSINSKKSHDIIAGDAVDDHTSSDAEEREGSVIDEYALLPSSPGGGEYYQPLGDASDDEEGDFEEEDEDNNNAADDERQLEATSVLVAPLMERLDTAKRERIMQSMQRIQIEPPSWAKNATLSDDDLVALVQRRLHIRSEAAD